MFSPSRSRRTEVVKFRASAQEAGWIAAEARRRDLTVSDFLRLALGRIAGDEP
jgi:hypothetical protein